MESDFSKSIYERP